MSLRTDISNGSRHKVVVSTVLSIVLLGASLTTAFADSVYFPKGTIGIGQVKSKPVVDATTVEEKVVVDDAAATPAALLTPTTKVAAAPAPAPAPAPRASAPAGNATASVASVVPTGEWQVAKCSWYGPGFYGRTTASGVTLQPDSMVVAHKTLPFGTRIEFSYNGRTAIALVEDRGPVAKDRIFDLGPGVAAALGFGGVGNVSYRFL